MATKTEHLSLRVAPELLEQLDAWREAAVPGITLPRSSAVTALVELGLEVDGTHPDVAVKIRAILADPRAKGDDAVAYLAGALEALAADLEG